MPTSSTLWTPTSPPFHFNDQWKITLGGRLFDTKVDGATSTSGLLEYLLTSPNVLSFVEGSPFTQYIVRPRTYGLTLDYRF